MKPQVRDALLALSQKSAGSITAAQVVDDARDPDSPLHPEFTWDDSIAGQKWRLSQARHLIRSVKIEVTTNYFGMHAPAFVRDPAAAPKTQGYVSLSRLRTDEDLAREAVLSEFKRASAALTRAKAIAAALGLSDEIENLHEQLDSLTDRIRGSDAGETASPS